MAVTDYLNDECVLKYYDNACPVESNNLDIKFVREQILSDPYYTNAHHVHQTIQAGAISYGKEFAYRNEYWAERPIPPVLDGLRLIAQGLTGACYDIALVKVYEQGNSLGLHQDVDGSDMEVACFTFATDPTQLCRLSFAKGKKNYTERFGWVSEANSMWSMSGKTNSQYCHRVLPADKPNAGGLRVSVSMRRSIDIPRRGNILVANINPEDLPNLENLSVHDDEDEHIYGASDDEQEPEQDKENYPVQPPLKRPKHDAVVSKALSAYQGSTANCCEDAFNNYTVDTLKRAGKTDLAVLKITDPVNLQSAKFMMDGRSVQKYNSKITKGTNDMARGHRMIEEGRRLQQQAYKDLMRYGTVLAIINHENENAGEKALQANQDQFVRTIKKEKQLLELQQEMELKKAIIEAEFKKL